MRLPASSSVFLMISALTVPTFAYLPKPSAVPPHPKPKPKFCPTALVCCDSFKKPYEPDAAHLIDLLKVELSAEEKALGVGLTCDAIVGYEEEGKKKRRTIRRHEFEFVDVEEEEEEDEFVKRGVDVCAKVSLCCDKAYDSGLLAIGCIEVSLY